MKIVHCAETVKGGVATYLNELIKGQISFYGQEKIKLIYPKDQIDSLSDSSKRVGVHFSSKKSRFISSIFMLRVLADILLNDDVEILHLHSTFAGFFGRFFLFPFLRKTKIIYCAHGWAWDKYSGFYRQLVVFVERFLARFSNKIICISEHDYKLAVLHGIDSRKLVLIKNGIGPVNNYSKDSCVLKAGGRVNMLFVGRLDRQKGIDLLLPVMEILPIDFHLHIVGDFVLNDIRCNATLDIDNISRYGWVDNSDISKYIAECDFLVMPSRWEGFGLVALEAMRMRKPVLANRVGGLSEIILPGVTGEFFSGEDPLLMAQDITDFASKNLAVLGDCAYKRWFEEYSSERLLSQVDSCYKELLGHA